MNPSFPNRYRLQCMVLAALWLCGAMVTVGQGPRTQPGPSDQPEPRRAAISDLGQENLNRVAASADQIQTVLLKDPGLLVELKRWIAKEATDNGQVVDDDNLTDQAVFDRLKTDVAFRSVATRLVQRYGYLRPALNPDSDFGKEQELLLKERARRLVQIETQEDTSSLQQPRAGTAVEKAGTCEGAEEADCERRGAGQQRRPGSSASQTVAPPETAPGLMPPTLPANAVPRQLRTGTNAEPSAGELVQTASIRDESPRSPRSGDGSFGRSLSSEAPGNMDPTLGSADERLSPPGWAGKAEMDWEMSQPDLGSDRSQPAAVSQEGRRIRRGTDQPSVAMLRTPNPYADIPSLYDLYVQASSYDRVPRRFGEDIFRDGLRDSRAIPMDLPVGPDYVVGPGDSISIDLWGGVSTRLVRVVDRAGRVSLPEAGPLLVSGHSLGDVQQAVQRAIATQFRDTSADVSVTRLRTVRVYVVGEVAVPGAYDISSLSTAMNALVAAGGVTPRGSLRKLKHLRGQQLLEEVDAYDLVLRGVKPDAGKLENGDTLLVPPVGAQVTVTGMVRRPAIYELNGEQTLAEALDLAGGILPAAALKHVEVQRVEAHDKRTMLSLDLSADGGNARELSSFKVRDGDQIHIFPIASYNQDAIYLQGHALRPGRYSYQKGMKLTDLISSYNDLLPEPAAHYAEIVRLNPPDFHPSVESFDLAAALTNPEAAPKLQPLDTVRVFSRFDFEPPPSVWVGGEVRSPGKYVTSGQAHLRDAVYLAGGLMPDASLESAQLFRTEAGGSSKILSVNLRAALAGDPIENILLEPRDRVLIHRNSERVDPASVDVRGEVAKPGRYLLTSNMQVDDLIRAAGGLKRSADTSKADLTRYPVGGIPGKHEEVSLAAVVNGNPTEDIPLHNGDVLTIRQVPGWRDLGAAVSVKGEVQHPATYGIQPGERLSSVLQRSGGFTAEAYPYGAVLIRREVRELEMKSHMELIRRVKAEETYLKALPEADNDQKKAKLTAVAQTETALQQLEATAPLGRVVIHIPPDTKSLARSAGDIPLRDGDEIVIPKKANYVMVGGQVFNPTAVGYRPGKSAKWYLSQSGGLTQIADKKAVFVIRADGSVLSAKNNSGLWSGDPMSAALRAGDSVVVPEKAPKIGSRNWASVMQAAQVAASVALTVAYVKP